MVLLTTPYYTPKGAIDKVFSGDCSEMRAKIAPRRAFRLRWGGVTAFRREPSKHDIRNEFLCQKTKEGKNGEYW
jgi:hypothetical protein